MLIASRHRLSSSVLHVSGVFVIDKAALLSGKAIADWHYSDKGKNALSGLHVGQMVMDGKGRIWFSTYTRLNCINPNNMKVVQVANSDVVNYLMADSKGNIWMGDNNSVTCYYAAGSVLGNSFSSKTWQIGGKASTMCDVEGKIWVVSGNEYCVSKSGSLFDKNMLVIISHFVTLI